MLLREVIAQNPLSSKEPGRVWAKKQDFPSLQRFGTEWLYAQKEDLLHEVLELEAERGLLGSVEGKYQDETPAELRKRALEELAHQESEKPQQPLPGLGPEHTGPASPEVEEQEQELPEIPDPTAKRACQCCCQTYSEILTFLEKRSEAEQRLREEEMALRREELEIQRGKITLERERLEAERRERERRFQLESQERQVILDLLKDRVLKY
ncbi:UNVERIFIED_CONTAM: hypothetical protein FKN15_041569 [Acipenser sinensis]